MPITWSSATDLDYTNTYTYDWSPLSGTTVNSISPDYNATTIYDIVTEQNELKTQINLLHDIIYQLKEELQAERETREAAFLLLSQQV